MIPTVPIDDIARTFCVLDVQSASLICAIDGKSHRKITDVNHSELLRILPSDFHFKKPTSLMLPCFYVIFSKLIYTFTTLWCRHRSECFESFCRDCIIFVIEQLLFSLSLSIVRRQVNNFQDFSS
jgi:hypothetical protein